MTTALRSPLQRLLVPAPVAGVPEGFDRVRESLRLGLPHRLSLAPNLDLIVFAAVGLAATWRSVDPFASVTRSHEQLEAAGGPSRDFTASPPARLLVARRSRPGPGETAFLAQLSLTAGRLRRLAVGASLGGGELDLVVLGWDIRAGTLRGAGDFGSWLELAWRPTPSAREVFAGMKEAEPVAAP